MKKTIFLFITAILCLSLLSCGNNKNSNNDIIATGTLEPQYEVQDEIVYAGYGNENNTNYPGDINRTDFKCETRMLAIHNIANNNEVTSNFDSIISLCQEYSNDIPFDCIAFCGGISGNGSETVYSATADCINTRLDDITMPIVSISNDEVAIAGTDWDSILGFPLNRSITVNELQITSISPDSSGSFNKSIDNIEEFINGVESTNSETPVLIVTGSVETDELVEILSKHPQAVLICADNKPLDKTIKRDKFTRIYIGDTSVYHVIEFDSDGRMLVRAVDNTGHTVKNANNEDVEWFIQTPWIME